MKFFVQLFLILICCPSYKYVLGISICDYVCFGTQYYWSSNLGK